MPPDHLSVEHFQQRMSDALRRLKMYERDGLKSFDEDPNGRWVDVTRARISDLKREIDLYERCIRYLESLQ